MEEASDNKMTPNNESKQESPEKMTTYVLTLQRACDIAYLRVTTNNVIANTKWASSLATAPSAISTMAILLKAADKKVAAGLEVESQEVKALDGITVVGGLPSKYFHTNLQHCSDVGRRAFLEAQHGMSTISATARSMIAEQGSLGYIIDLLEDPEEARYNLKPEIDALKKTAKKCLDNASSITAKFEYWYLVITHLKQTSLSKRGDVVKEKDVTVTKKQGATQDQAKYREKKILYEQKIQTVQKRLNLAERNVERAQIEVDRLRDTPIILEPSILDEIERVKRMIPPGEASFEDRGMLWDIKNAFVGKSAEHKAEDDAVQKAHDLRVQKMQDNALQQAKDQRNSQRGLAAKRLQEALDIEEQNAAALSEAYNELDDSEYQLAEAKINLEKAKGELNLLNNKEIELTGIMAILENSTQKLGLLKEQIEPLVDFFKDVLGDIDHNVDENLAAFLRPIENGITGGSKPEEIEAINMSRRSKEKMMSAALQMQGRFSAIADISTAYVTVSKEYIRPAINEMEILSTVPESEWPVKSNEFINKCDKLMTDIGSFAKETNTTVDGNIGRHINSLQLRAIKAATENKE